MFNFFKKEKRTEVIVHFFYTQQHYREIFKWDAPFWVKRDYVKKYTFKLADNFSFLCNKFKKKKLFKKPEYNFQCKDKECFLNDPYGCCNGAWVDLLETADSKIMVKSYNKIIKKLVKDNNYLNLKGESENV
jgi:hypothetical protein